MFVNKFFIYLTCAYLKSKRCFDVKSSTYYFHMKTKILADFQICINFPLRYISNDLSVQLAKYLLKLLVMIFESKIFLILRMRCFAICLTNSNNNRFYNLSHAHKFLTLKSIILLLLCF